MRQVTDNRRLHQRVMLRLAAFALITTAFLSCATSVPRETIATRERELLATPHAKYRPVEEGSAQVTDEEADTKSNSIPEEEILGAYITIALQENAGLRAAFDRWVAAMETIPQVTALPDPQFSWTYFVERVQTRTGEQDNRFQLSQMFPWFGKLKLQGEASARAAESLWWEVEAKRLRVVRDVKNAYFEYAYLGRAIQILKENLSLLKSLEPIVQRSIQVGGSQADLIRLQVEIGKLENDLATLEDFRVPISSRLRAVLNLRGSEALPWPLLDEKEIRAFDREAVRKQFESLNPELKALFEQIERAAILARRARLDGYPDLMLGVMYIDTDDAGPLPQPPTSSEPPRFPEGSGDDPWGVTLGFNLPIWRGKYKAGVREAHAIRASAEQQLQQKRFDLSAEFDLKTYELDDAARQIDLYRNTLIPRAQQALEVTEISYESGDATFLDVIDTQRELLAFERAYWRFVATYEQRIADLELLSGGPLP